jgi:O-antigen/teichoic acid export membrane protein
MMESLTERLTATDADVLQTARNPAFTSSLIHILTGQFACAAIALLTEIIYARFLGPAARGLISLCLMSIGFAALIGGLGGEGSMVYWSSRSRHGNSAWLPAVLLWGVLGSAAAVAVWSCAYWRLNVVFLHGITPALAKLILACIPVAILFAYVMAFLAGIEEFRLRSVSAFSRQAIGMIVCMTFLAIAGRTVQAALWGILCGLLVASGMTVWLVRRKLFAFWRLRNIEDQLAPTLRYGLRGFIGNLATFFTYRLDVFFVNYFLQPAQVGFYALGVAISESLWQIPQAVASALFPRTARTQEINGSESTRFACFIFRQVFLITTLCGILIAAISPIAIPLIFGRAFRPSISVVLWILPGTIALSIGKVACADLAGRGKNGYSSVFALICFAVTIGLDWLLIPTLGIVGASIASSVAYFINTFLILMAVRRELKVTWKDLFYPTDEEPAAYRNLLNRVKAATNRARAERNRLHPDISVAGSP